MKQKLFTLFLVAFAWSGISIDTIGHEIRPGYLEIKEVSDDNYQIKWKVPKLGNRIPKIDFKIAENFELTQVSETAGSTFLIKTYRGHFPGELRNQTISILGLENTLIDVFVNISLFDETSYSFLLQPDRPSITVPMVASNWEMSKSYLWLGVEHILMGYDHLLFVLGLLLLISGWGNLLKTITAFTVAHSITLGLATFELMDLPQAPVEAVIALSILFLAKENLNKIDGKSGLAIQWPWLVAILFGLLHGFGFAGALSEIGFPQNQVPLALFVFNLGVEIGQLFFVAGFFLIKYLLQKIVPKWPSFAPRILPYFIGICSAYWLIDRVLSF